MKPRYLISACLVGQKTKYDGSSNYNERISELYKDGAGVLICPEIMGGLETPRIPCEIINNKVINKNGEEKTEAFKIGAYKALDLASRFNIKKAILKSNSPSCGYKKVYDGTFSNNLIDGNGITTQLLLDNGFTVYDENIEPIYDAIVLCAGNSDRCHINYNKVFHYCKDHTVIEQTLEPFLTDIYCNSIILVAKESEIPLFKAVLASSRIKYVVGGESREESAFEGLKASKMPFVLIHDGDRPYLTNELVDNIVNELKNGADNCIPYIEELDESRNYCIDDKCIQTPQGFQTKKLLNEFLNKQSLLKEYRDESSIYNKKLLNFINGEPTNKKITYFEDLKEFEELNKK